MYNIFRFFCVLTLLLTSFNSIEGRNYLNLKAPQTDHLTFDYSIEELSPVKSLPQPDSTLSNEQLSYLISEVDYQMELADLSGMDQTIIPPYLANAQKDFAWLSYLITGKFSGDLRPVTLWTLRLFIPNASLASIEDTCFDPFSCGLASIVVSKAAERLQQEKKQLAEYPIKHGNGVWTPTSPGYVGLDYGSVKTWFLTSSREHVANIPPKTADFWNEQTSNIKSEQKSLDGKKVQAVFEWAGLTSMKAGKWKHILDDYLNEKQIPIGDRLYIRSTFLSALGDANAVSFNSKYTFWIERPSQRDGDVNPLITIPNHPSYPSAHSTISGTAATVLSEYFPSDSKKWNALAEESGMSRIWGGIHYLTDHEAGLKLGNETGKTILQRTQM